jgi:hypothetical protein
LHQDVDFMSGTRVYVVFVVIVALHYATVCAVSQIPPPRNRPGRAPASHGNPKHEITQKKAQDNSAAYAFTTAVNAFQTVQQEQLSLAASNNPSARVLVYRICCGEMGNRFLVRPSHESCIFSCRMCICLYDCALGDLNTWLQGFVSSFLLAMLSNRCSFWAVENLYAFSSQPLAGLSWSIGLPPLRRLTIRVSSSAIVLLLQLKRSFLTALAVANFLRPPPGFGNWFWNHFLAQSPHVNISHKKLGACHLLLLSFSVPMLRLLAGFHNGGPEHFGHLLCDDWARSFSDTSILFVESNQYFAAALRHNPHHVGTCPNSNFVLSFLFACRHFEFLVSSD